MINRIVKMTFNEKDVDMFLNIFKQNNSIIRNFKGCKYLELVQDMNDPRIFFTLSQWESESDLEEYRCSQFFSATWGKTKILFQEKPKAWSTKTIAI